MTIISSYSPSSTQASETNHTQTTAPANTNTESSLAEQTATSTFSTRSEKLAQLNSEFDIRSSGFRLNQEFISRMAELGLISGADAEGLNSGLPVNADGDKTTDTVQQLNHNIDILSERYQDDPTLIDILNHSKQVLANFDGTENDQLPSDPFTLAAKLNNYLKSDDATKLTDDERESLQELKLAMTVADRLTPDKRSSAELGKYMEIFKSYQ